jgi:hypothetical protein
MNPEEHDVAQERTSRRRVVRLLPVGVAAAPLVSAFPNVAAATDSCVDTSCGTKVGCLMKAP